MITKEKAFEIAKEYLKIRKRQYVDIDTIDEIIFSKNEEVLYGKYEGEKMPVFNIGYGQYWGIEIQSMYITISAETGEVLYSISPTSWIEEIEDLPE